MRATSCCLVVSLPLAVQALLGNRNQFELSPRNIIPWSAENRNNRIPEENLNFDDWIADAPQEVTEWKRLVVNGVLPDYLIGTLIRNGGAIWSKGDDTMYSHIFDGLAKVSAYRFGPGGVVDYKNVFIQSNLYKKTQQYGKMIPTLSVGPFLSKIRRTTEGDDDFLQLIRTIWNSLSFDNTSVNVWDYNPRNNSPLIAALTDLPARGILSKDTLSTVACYAAAPTPLQGLQGYEFQETAHPLYSLTSDDTYNVAVGLTLQGPQLCVIRESAIKNGQRTIIGKVSCPEGIPYLHSFGVTDRYAVVVLPPVRSSFSDLRATLRVGFLRSMISVPQTRVLLFDLVTGECIVDQNIDDAIYFYHAISTAKQTNVRGEEEISIRLCAYQTPDIMTGEDQFMRLERCQGSKEARNRITRGGTFCDVIINTVTKCVDVKWIPMPYGQGFELPTTRYSRVHGPGAEYVSQQHPQYVYAYGTYALGANEYDAWGLFKFEPERGRIVAAYRKASVYVSEPIFVADPRGRKEDDGVLLSQVYDGNRRETALLVLDAKTMDIVAEIWTGNRSPMDFHGGWFPLTF